MFTLLYAKKITNIKNSNFQINIIIIDITNSLIVIEFNIIPVIFIPFLILNLLAIPKDNPVIEMANGQKWYIIANISFSI